MQHPYKRVNDQGRPRLEHIVIAEKALGRPLPPGAQVHHFNEDKRDNSPGNLVICPDAAYHQLIHTRAKALAACGNANWLRCAYCKKYDAPENMTVTVRSAGSRLNYHNSCNTAAAKQFRKK
jgi:hypothetical protein